jgi:hypothetical protein
MKANARHASRRARVRSGASRRAISGDDPMIRVLVTLLLIFEQLPVAAALGAL